MTALLSRRALALSLAGSTVAVATAAIPAPKPALTSAEILAKVKALGPDGARAFRAMANEYCDEPLRELWDQYLVQDAINEAAWKSAHEARNAFDAVHEPNWDELNEQPWEENTPIRDAYNNRLIAALAPGEPLAVLWDTANQEGKRLSAIIQTIRETPAEGLYGIGVKLAAMPNQWQAEDVEQAAGRVFEDIDRAMGSTFADVLDIEPWKADEEGSTV